MKRQYASIAICLIYGAMVSRPGTGLAEENEIPTMIWEFNNLKKVGGNETTILGAPRLVTTPHGDAIEFDGENDGLVVDIHPLAGATQFTAEVVFKPSSNGPAEQRFFHIQENGLDENRIMFETRIVDGNRWFMDTFIKSGDQECTLYAEAFPHPTDRWYHGAIVYDGKTMHHFVDRKKELSQALVYKPQGEGRTSVGVRLNRVYWYQGAIRKACFTPRALSPDEFHLD